MICVNKVDELSGVGSVWLELSEWECVRWIVSGWQLSGVGNIRMGNVRIGNKSGVRNLMDSFCLCSGVDF